MYQPQITPYLQNNPYYQYQQYQRMAPQMDNTQAIAAPQNNFLKGRPVTSIEEAKVAQIDFDGALNIFTDIANKRIYTKQINLDGTSSFNVYCLTELEPEPILNNSNYMTKDEASNLVTREEYNSLLSQIEELNKKINSSVKETKQAVAPIKGF